MLALLFSFALASDSQTMVTSWYGKKFAGRPTANGEIFDPDGLTAAHKTLPFGTRLKLTNPTTGKTVSVRVNDRGPFIKGRHLDVSRRAAELLGMRDKGVVALEVVKVED